MIKAAAFNLICAAWAYQQACMVYAAHNRFGIVVAATVLFYCFLANKIAGGFIDQYRREK